MLVGVAEDHVILTDRGDPAEALGWRLRRSASTRAVRARDLPGCRCQDRRDEIEQLRAHAEKELGAKFDIRDFHDAVLRNGALPLELLEKQIHRYIASKQ
jgi:hypothetical protein